MIDAVARALIQIHNTIPYEVLSAAFNYDEYSDQSLDDLIKEKVILTRVRDDISIRGGKVFDLILSLDWAKYTSSPSPYALGISGSYSTFVIPPEAREHRDISCVLSVRFPYTISTSITGSFYNSCSVQGNTLGGLACAALQSQTGAQQLANPYGQIYPGNTIVLNPPQISFIPWNVRVRLRYDDNFSGMDVSTLRPFVHVCELATKAYIYTHLKMKIESNMVFRGAEIGVMAEFVNAYADANDQYDEALLQLGGAEFYDPTRLHFLLSKCLPKR